MPRGDRTGPEGMGSGTGRRAGYCYGNDVAGFQDAGYGRGGGGRMRGFGPVAFGGRGLGFRRGGGRGGRTWFGRGAWVEPGYYDAYAPDSRSEREILESSVAQMKSSLQSMEERLSQLQESGSSEEK